MTWGQLRLHLSILFPGAPPDLLDRWINSRYEQVLIASKWVGTTYHATIETTAAYQSTTDTIDFSVGDAGVVGVGTTWTKSVLGLSLYRPGDTVIYTVTAWSSATGLTLDRPYEGVDSDGPGTTYSNAAYVLMQDIYPLPADVDNVVSCMDPVEGFPLQKLSSEEMDNSCGTRTLVEDPTSWAIWDDTNENADEGAVVHQVRFYPPPLYAHGIPIKYEHLANGFDGSNTSAGPLPWVTDSVLQYGSEADGYAYLAGANPERSAGYLGLAKACETKYQEQLSRLLLAEHWRRRKQVTVKVADRFVAHRLARAARGQNNTWRGGTPGGPY
jgi:hypothetical protein